MAHELEYFVEARCPCSGMTSEPEDLIRLTPREVTVLRRAATGHTVRVVARDLNITPATVNKHLENAYRKLGVTNRLSAVLLALRHGLI